MAFKRNCDNAFNYHDFVEYLTTTFPERIGKFNKMKGYTNGDNSLANCLDITLDQLKKAYRTVRKDTSKIDIGGTDTKIGINPYTGVYDRDNPYVTVEHNMAMLVCSSKRKDEVPVYFMMYKYGYDCHFSESYIHVFIPTKGNTYDKKNKCAYNELDVEHIIQPNFDLMLDNFYANMDLGEISYSELTYPEYLGDIEIYHVLDSCCDGCDNFGRYIIKDSTSGIDDWYIGDSVKHNITLKGLPGFDKYIKENFGVDLHLSHIVDGKQVFCDYNCSEEAYKEWKDEDERQFMTAYNYVEEHTICTPVYDRINHAITGFKTVGRGGVINFDIVNIRPLPYEVDESRL